MLEAVLAFLSGLLIGSFLNVCVFRLPRDLSVVRPRSFCPGCEKQIAWYDNIPVVSYLLLGGKCRHCQARIPLRYLIVELATGAAFALCVGALGPTLAALKWSIFSAILITLTSTDFEERILPDEFTLGGALLGYVLAAVVPIDAGIVTFFLSNAMGLRMASVAEALEGARYVVLAVPSHGLRGVLRGAASAIPPDAVLVSATKGLESHTLLRMSEVVAEETGAGLLRQKIAWHR